MVLMSFFFFFFPTESLFLWHNIIYDSTFDTSSLQTQQQQKQQIRPLLLLQPPERLHWRGEVAQFRFLCCCERSKTVPHECNFAAALLFRCFVVFSGGEFITKKKKRKKKNRQGRAASALTLSVLILQIVILFFIFCFFQKTSNVTNLSTATQNKIRTYIKKKNLSHTHTHSPALTPSVDL